MPLNTEEERKARTDRNKARKAAKRERKLARLKAKREAKKNGSD